MRPHIRERTRRYLDALVFVYETTQPTQFAIELVSGFLCVQMAERSLSLFPIQIRVPSLSIMCRVRQNKNTSICDILYKYLPCMITNVNVLLHTSMLGYVLIILDIQCGQLYEMVSNIYNSKHDCFSICVSICIHVWKRNLIYLSLGNIFKVAI